MSLKKVTGTHFASVSTPLDGGPGLHPQLLVTETTRCTRISIRPHHFDVIFDQKNVSQTNAINSTLPSICQLAKRTSYRVTDAD